MRRGQEQADFAAKLLIHEAGDGAAPVHLHPIEAVLDPQALCLDRILHRLVRLLDGIDGIAQRRHLRLEFDPQVDMRHQVAGVMVQLAARGDLGPVRVADPYRGRCLPPPPAQAACLQIAQWRTTSRRALASGLKTITRSVSGAAGATRAARARMARSR